MDSAATTARHRSVEPQPGQLETSRDTSASGTSLGEEQMLQLQPSPVEMAGTGDANGATAGGPPCAPRLRARHARTPTRTSSDHNETTNVGSGSAPQGCVQAFPEVLIVVSTLAADWALIHRVPTYATTPNQ